MAKRPLKRPKKKRQPGLPPGSIIFTGKRKVEKILIHYLAYDDSSLKEQQVDNQSMQVFHQPQEGKVQWYDFRGLHDTQMIAEVGRVFGVHPLVLEDIADTDQRPKIEENPQGIFLVVHALRFDPHTEKAHKEQVAIYFGEGYVLSFQEDETDLFSAVRERLQQHRGKIRSRGADYLAYALLDYLVDNYFVVLEDIEGIIEGLEEQIMVSPEDGIKSQIHHLKREMITIRKSMAPLREAVSRFSKITHPSVSEGTGPFLQDLYDHIIQVLDMVDTFRDMLTSLQELYVSELSNRMNQVMQLLTVITSIFVPLSFIVGLYGMNFSYMPELEYRNGYFVLWGIMALIGVGMWAYFKRKKWI